jgi:hypothetical protein
MTSAASSATAATERASDAMAIESPPSRDLARAMKATYENVFTKNAIAPSLRQDDSLLHLCSF